MSAFNERMRYIKDSLGIKGIEMSERLGIPNSTLSTYLRYREADCDTLIKIAKEFNVSINWLIGYCEDDEKTQGYETLMKENEALIKENAMLKAKLRKIANISMDVI